MSRGRAYMPQRLIGAVALLAASLLAAAHLPALAGPVENRVAVFAALDKITGDITTLQVPVDSEARFGTFRIRPRTCHTRPPTEEPRTMAFVQIEEYTYDKKHRRIFSGWMNAESPGLHAVEHPLFDVWLTGCAQPLKAAANTFGGAAAAGGATAASPSGAAGPAGKAFRGSAIAPRTEAAGKGDSLLGDAATPPGR